MLTELPTPCFFHKKFSHTTPGPPAKAHIASHRNRNVLSRKRVEIESSEWNWTESKLSPNESAPLRIACFASKPALGDRFFTDFSWVLTPFLAHVWRPGGPPYMIPWPCLMHQAMSIL